MILLAREKEIKLGDITIRLWKNWCRRAKATDMFEVAYIAMANVKKKGDEVKVYRYRIECGRSNKIADGLISCRTGYSE